MLDQAIVSAPSTAQILAARSVSSQRCTGSRLEGHAGGSCRTDSSPEELLAHLYELARGRASGAVHSRLGTGCHQVLPGRGCYGRTYTIARCLDCCSGLSVGDCRGHLCGSRHLRPGRARSRSSRASITRWWPDRPPATPVSARGVAVDSSGNLYIADPQNDVIEKVTPGGTLSIIAGTGHVGTADGRACHQQQPEPP